MSIAPNDERRSTEAMVRSGFRVVLSLFFGAVKLKTGVDTSELVKVGMLEYILNGNKWEKVFPSGKRD